MGNLDIIIIFFGCIVEVLLIYDYFNNFFEVKIKSKYLYVICIGAVITIFGINLLQNSVANLTFVPLVLWCFVSLLFDTKVLIRLLYFIVAYIVMIGVEFLYVIMSNTTVELLDKTGLIPVSEYLWQLLVVKFLNYIVFIILKQTSTKSKSRMTNNLFLSYLCVPIASLGIMLITFYSGVNLSNNWALKILMTLFFVFLIVGNMLLFYAFQKYTENLSESSKQQLEIIYQKAEVERLTKIVELNDDYNEIIHNASHYLKVIGQLAYEKKEDEIYAIVDKINEKLNKGNIYQYSSHKMLNVILSEYSTKAKNANVNFDAYVEPGCILDGIQDMDLIAIIGNLLDNALCAASQNERDSSIVVRIFMQKNGRICVIKVVNDFTGELKEIRGKLISTKKDVGIHGIGIASVSKNAEQYGGCFEYYVENEKFNAIVILPME